MAVVGFCTGVATLDSEDLGLTVRTYVESSVFVTAVKGKERKFPCKGKKSFHTSGRAEFQWQRSSYKLLSHLQRK